jgi:hypothetical protein
MGVLILCVDWDGAFTWDITRTCQPYHCTTVSSLLPRPIALTPLDPTPPAPCPAGTVLKRWDSTRLYMLSQQDVVERFHLLIILIFVVVEEMGASGHRRANAELVMQVVVGGGGDVVK